MKRRQFPWRPSQRFLIVSTLLFASIVFVGISSVVSLRLSLMILLACVVIVLVFGGLGDVGRRIEGSQKQPNRMRQLLWAAGLVGLAYLVVQYGLSWLGVLIDLMGR